MQSSHIKMQIFVKKLDVHFYGVVWKVDNKLIFEGVIIKLLEL
jgi:hypothetical protein